MESYLGITADLEPGEIPQQELSFAQPVACETFILPESPSNIWTCEGEFILPDDPEDIWQRQDILQHCDSKYQEYSSVPVLQHVSEESTEILQHFDNYSSVPVLQNVSEESTQILKPCRSDTVLPDVLEENIEILQHCRSDTHVSEENIEILQQCRSDTVLPHVSETCDAEVASISEVWQPHSELQIKDEIMEWQDEPQIQIQQLEKQKSTQFYLTYETKVVKPLEEEIMVVGEAIDLNTDQINKKFPAESKLASPCRVMLDRLDVHKHFLQKSLEIQVTKFEENLRNSEVLFDEASISKAVLMKKHYTQIVMSQKLREIRAAYPSEPSKVALYRPLDTKNKKSNGTPTKKSHSKITSKVQNTVKNQIKKSSSKITSKVQNTVTNQLKKSNSKITSKVKNNVKNQLQKSNLKNTSKVQNVVENEIQKSNPKSTVLDLSKKVRNIIQNKAKKISKARKVHYLGKYSYVKEEIYKYTPCFLEDHNYFNDIPKISLPSYIVTKYDCPYCTRSWFYVDDTIRHCKQVHKEIVDVEDIQGVQGVMYKCNKCTLTDETMLKIENHRHSHHKEFRVTRRDLKRMCIIKDEQRKKYIVTNIRRKISNEKNMQSVFDEEVPNEHQNNDEIIKIKSTKLSQNIAVLEENEVDFFNPTTFDKVQNDLQLLLLDARLNGENNLKSSKNQDHSKSSSSKIQDHSKSSSSKKSKVTKVHPIGAVNCQIAVKKSKYPASQILSSVSLKPNEISEIIRSETPKISQPELKRRRISKTVINSETCLEKSPEKNLNPQTKNTHCLQWGQDYMKKINASKINNTNKK